MPDLATHSLLATILQRVTREKISLILILVGTILPDILSRAPIILSSHLEWMAVPFHSPIPLFVLAYLVSMLFQEQSRKQVFISLLTGMYFHLFLDMLQWHVADHNYFWLYPFSQFQFELGLFDSNTVFTFLPFLIILVLGFELLRKHRSSKF
ncbi:MAG: hypothetical protein A2161_15470 [Candidatus Schekmanbacteria bacterium RBG_13_48_7]|uniref:Metal-dependent hydrolase n=1 Tax=Candidatus Schekmanbacteria bacterium RBG_13_48_7 TaxID=1817878 RepID=A0A1F7S1B6_9BACT|nr:MAG: hypothetical protein A2161_15470 [Candidatus Schekmanbacteria bacterium RBG_13_48_7]